MGLFNRNNNNNEPITVENIQAMKESILAGNYVEIQIPTITSIADNVLAAKEVTLFGNRPIQAANGGVNTLWNITELYFGENACCISLGGRLFPYKFIECIMKHPVNIDRYGLVLTTGEIINFNFSEELQCVAALELFRDFGVEVIK